ncbi:hypothetical protein EDB86DRAFT_2880248 [Lactarius hatsudake]|nr:hypothetical protein EDB86DRAFT_2880248 [Lactarius hatsudake]
MIFALTHSFSFFPVDHGIKLQNVIASRNMTPLQRVQCRITASTWVSCRDLLTELSPIRRLRLDLTKYPTRLSASFISFIEAPFTDTPTPANGTRVLVCLEQVIVVLGSSFPSTAVIPRTAGTTLLENILSYFDDDDHSFFDFRLDRDLWDSSLAFGQLDLPIANNSGGFAYSHVYQGSRSAPGYWKLPLRTISMAASSSLTSHMDVAAFWGIVGGGARKGNELWQIKRNCGRSSGC